MSAKIINGEQTIIIRDPGSIYHSEGEAGSGHFQGRWHYSYESYHHRDYTHFGTLRLFNDDILSPGAAFDPHPHSNVEVVTYCVDGEFRHGDDGSVVNRGTLTAGGELRETEASMILRKGWAQRLTVGSGLWHSEINNRTDTPVRFIQMWFLPTSAGLEPSRFVRRVEEVERVNSFLPLVDNDDSSALDIASDARVYSCLLRRGNLVSYILGTGRGLYLYIMEGGPVLLNGTAMPELAATKVIGGDDVSIRGDDDTELLLVDVPLAFVPR